MEVILPVLNMETLQEKATQYAMQGALESIKDYYTGWTSPFRKAIDEELKSKSIGTGLDLPDIIGLINTSLSNEIDVIANSAVAETFVPLVKRFLTREKDEMMFSEVLKEVIRYSNEKEYENCSMEINERPSPYDWLELQINMGEVKYDITLHLDYNTKKEAIKKYCVLSLPRRNEEIKNRVMKITDNNVTLELPFIPDVLKNPIVSFFARMIIAKTKITMDCKDFDESMFPEDECHCHE